MISNLGISIRNTMLKPFKSHSLKNKEFTHLVVLKIPYLSFNQLNIFKIYRSKAIQIFLWIFSKRINIFDLGHFGAVKIYVNSYSYMYTEIVHLYKKRSNRWTCIYLFCIVANRTFLYIECFSRVKKSFLYRG